ncbi:penicillin-binding protein PBP1A [Streptococcus thermophilus]|uniref:Penicillin-insensitive transglycosylase / Penicillin-sensitive transpeptidase n=1 Tax=Streptococcus thermophilus TaxID=1308 RepID=A0AAU9HD28_STRTR|nr:penicillin-binding protein PBP1A [Streptococcus thermophilus]MCT2943433.1 PBP1A family penicillin-binding protein [Streptococcus thermophilus]MDG0263806.1 penicillin-binding protein PBP1A [Streptococcus thermophilus]UYI02777.1 PBP1A family penicillin-binding protein [Streptococcus thermophilus]UYX67772.1 PBP1A family penicillin-binding protein [Streptococcus thermophilus]CAD0154084.1 Penicillin-insensitive transglycosylase / Penicillin-sensitive transpeptidase [Streptococcus thermophilus]
MAKFNFSNFKESLNGSTKRAKNTQVKRSDSSRYSKGKRSAASDQNLGWRIAKYAFIGLLTFFVICVIAGGGLFAYYVSSVPKLTENKLQSTNSSRIYDGNGSLIADLGSEKRESASTDEIPIILVNAITSIEDKRFFTHRGIDVYRIMGAAINNLRHNSTQGGSTLDQQLIKLAYFSTNTSDQTLKRKSQEIWLSLQMERQYTKQEILTFYVNKVYMGNGYYGMKTAAKSYFGKELGDLSVAQAALLAGIPQAPTQYDPYANPDAAKERRNTVLNEMYEDKNISKEEYEQAKATDVSDGLLPLTNKASYEPYLDNYIKQVIEQVSTEANADIYSAGLDVYTNLDPDIQKYIWNVYNSNDYIAYPDDKFQVASTIIDVTNGHVVAQLGSRHQDENIALGTNQAVQTDRDWGSTMKPITDYAPAIEKRVYTNTGTTVYDTPYNFPGTSTPVYNWDRKYYGSISLTYAIQKSRNVPAVKALQATGLEYAQSFLKDLGIEYPEMFYSNAISSSTTSSDPKYGASSEKMAAAYAAFANGGTYYKPSYIKSIKFEDGSTKSYDSKGVEAMSPQTAYMMNSMLKQVLTGGTATEAYVPGTINAGKTGTSSYSDDEYYQVQKESGVYADLIVPDETFVGYNTKYAMAIWTGYENRKTPLYGSDLNIAKQIYGLTSRYLNQMYGAGSKDFDMPSGVYNNGSYVFLTGSSTSNVYNGSLGTSSSSSSSDYGKSSDSSSSQDSQQYGPDASTNPSTSGSNGAENSNSNTSTSTVDE